MLWNSSIAFTKNVTVPVNLNLKMNQIKLKRTKACHAPSEQQEVNNHQWGEGASAICKRCLCIFVFRRWVLVVQCCRLVLLGMGIKSHLTTHGWTFIVLRFLLDHTKRPSSGPRSKTRRRGWGGVNGRRASAGLHLLSCGLF